MERDWVANMQAKLIASGPSPRAGRDWSAFARRWLAGWGLLSAWSGTSTMQKRERNRGRPPAGDVGNGHWSIWGTAIGLLGKRRPPFHAGRGPGPCGGRKRLSRPSFRQGGRMDKGILREMSGTPFRAGRGRPGGYWHGPLLPCVPSRTGRRAYESANAVFAEARIPSRTGRGG